MENKKLMELYLKERGFTKTSGFAIKTEELANNYDYEETFFEGKNLQEAIAEYVRAIKEYWIYEPSDGEQIFEDIEDALEYAEEGSDVSFEDYKKARK